MSRGSRRDEANAAVRPLNPGNLPKAVDNYAHGILVQPGQLLFVSGQVPWGHREGKVPKDFETQCLHVWQHVESVLGEGGMTPFDIVKLTTFLASRSYAEAYGRIAQRALGRHRAAQTIVICNIYAPEWLLEVEAVAAR